MPSGIWSSVQSDEEPAGILGVLEAEVKTQLDKQSQKLFCEGQEDMLVELAILSNNGKSLSSLSTRSHIYHLVGVESFEFETEKELEAYLVTNTHIIIPNSDASINSHDESSLDTLDSDKIDETKQESQSSFL